MKKTLFIIPARAGSKGIPGKNIKMLAAKPLIQYSIEVARALVDDEMICVSSDDPKIIALCNSIGLEIPFVRPAELGSDNAGSYEVVVHALEYYLKQGKNVDTIVLLQPTSPFRKPEHIQEAMTFWDDKTDLIVGVKKTKANPYYVLMEENEAGYLEICKAAKVVNRRQDVPPVYELNGALYIIDAKKLLEQKSLRDFKRTKKYVMSEIHSVDIDEPLDWIYAESILKSGLLDL